MDGGGGWFTVGDFLIFIHGVCIFWIGYRVPLRVSWYGASCVEMVVSPEAITLLRSTALASLFFES